MRRRWPGDDRLRPSPGPSPSPDPDERFTVRGTTEIGARWVDVNGFENKFRSDFNYRTGFRLFDSSLVIDDNSSSGRKLFDSAMIIASGWGADPSGMVRVNMERSGQYRLDANVRRIAYHSDLRNFAIGGDLNSYRNHDTRRNIGDFDLTILPENPNIRFRAGYSYNFNKGTGFITSRVSDVFPANFDADSRAHDFRFGADGNLKGWKLSGTYGHRAFDDDTSFRSGPHPGDNRTNQIVIESMRLLNPITSSTNYGVFNVQRTFAQRFDLAAKIVHSSTSMDFNWNETVNYRSNTNVPTTDVYVISGQAKRPQTRGDLGMTWAITDKFRLSNTFTFDIFNINGGNLFALDRITAATARTRQFNYLVTRYRRYMNTFEGDYQFSPRFGINLGYRYTHREANLMWTGLNTLNNTNLSGSPKDESGTNSTNTFLAGTRFKPTTNWTVYLDVETGRADNVFTRVANYKFTNFRVRSRANFDKFAFNTSFITKDNENPGRGPSGQPETFLTESRNRLFSMSVDWDPVDTFRLTTGYDYNHLTSEAFIRVPISGVQRDGLSQYYIRDNYFFVDVDVRPHRRVSFFGSYRWNKDRGQGDREIPPLNSPIIVGSYPIDLKMPEFRAAFRINSYIDWNVGYQYFDYKENPPQNMLYGLPNQNYNAHLPYTSLRIYLGRSRDR
jgi:hypothetical protein